MKLCTDCKYSESLRHITLCTHDKAVTGHCLVTGSPRLKPCASMRDAWFAKCGKKAKLFEPKA